MVVQYVDDDEHADVFEGGGFGRGGVDAYVFEFFCVFFPLGCK